MDNQPSAEAEQYTADMARFRDKAAGWWLTGWQRLWRKPPNDEHHEIRIWRKLQGAEDRYQRENKTGRYSLPNTKGSREAR